MASSIQGLHCPLKTQETHSSGGSNHTHPTPTTDNYWITDQITVLYRRPNTLHCKTIWSCATLRFDCCTSYSLPFHYIFQRCWFVCWSGSCEGSTKENACHCWGPAYYLQVNIYWLALDVPFISFHFTTSRLDIQTEGAEIHSQVRAEQLKMPSWFTQNHETQL